MSLYGVADGVSSLVPYKNKENKTGGFIASNDVKCYFEEIQSYTNLSHDLALVNKRIQGEMKENGINILKKEELWGAAVALVKITKSGIEFVQTGDCMILAIYEDKSVRPLTRIQTEHLERVALNRWQELIHNGVNMREKLMGEVKDILIFNRQQSNTSDGYGVLIGENQANDYFEQGRINKNRLKHLIIITDGLFLPEKIVPKGESYWEYTAKCMLQKGIQQYAKELIELEETDLECVLFPRFKMSDDKAGMLLTF